MMDFIYFAVDLALALLQLVVSIAGAFLFCDYLAGRLLADREGREQQ